nr:MAG TPA_asm: hypothetical protein [Caudoviricetes sp.]
MTRWAMRCMRSRGARMAPNWRTHPGRDSGRLTHSAR